MESRTIESCGRRGLRSESWLSSHPSSAGSRGARGPVLGGTSGAPVSLALPSRAGSSSSLYLLPGPLWHQASSGKSVGSPCGNSTGLGVLLSSLGTDTHSCLPAPTVAWVRASAEWELVADPTQSQACGRNPACGDQKEPSPCS